MTTASAAHAASVNEVRARPSLLYRGLRSVIRAALRVFYGQIEATGLDNVDPTLPTIIACNHPNSIVDPLLLGMFEERQIAFCARDGLFKIPVFGSVLRSVGAIPIRRRAEHAAADNNDAFSAARDVLDKGGVMAIFPEGKTHGHLRIEPVKTGVARIALGTRLASTPAGLRIVPVGVTYLVRHAFRSDVHIAFGEPIVVNPTQFDASKAVDHPDNVRALTDRIGDALRNLSVHIDRTEDERLIAQVTSIVVGIRADEGLDEHGQSPAERTALVRRVVDAYRWLSKVDPEKTAELRERIDHFIEEREALGLGGERPALQHRGEQNRRLKGNARTAFLVAGAPFALFGLATSMVPYAILRAAMRLMPVTTDRIALFKLLGGTAVFGAAYAAEIVLVTTFVGPLPAIAFGAALVPCAMFARRYSIEARLHRLQSRTLLAWRRSARLDALRDERGALAKELADLRQRYLAQN